jgi:hypothetical protein
VRTFEWERGEREGEREGRERGERERGERLERERGERESTSPRTWQKYGTERVLWDKEKNASLTNKPTNGQKEKEKETSNHEMGERKKFGEKIWKFWMKGRKKREKNNN